jgi:hypothetical protein
LPTKGDIIFGKNITITGNVKIINCSYTQVVTPDGTGIEKDTAF